MTKILILSFSFLIIFTGCQQANLLELQDNFRKIEITNSTDSATLILFVKMANPNPFQLEISTIKYKLSIDQNPCSEGTFDKPIVLERNQEKTISLPLWIPYHQLDKVSLSVLQNKILTAKYRLVGEIFYFDSDGKQKKQSFVVDNF